MAHIPDGFLNAPVLVGTAALSAGALAVAARRSRTHLGEQEAPLLGAATAFVFAAQMFNFPLGAGTSAHLLGGVLVAVLVGPWSALVVMFSVVLVQALLFQDGGVAALGANTLNVAVLGSGAGYLTYRWLLALVGFGPKRQLGAAMAAAYLSAVLVGTAAALELALSGIVPLRAALIAVAGAHLVVGLAEAGLTGAILGFVLRSRPQLLAAAGVISPGQRRWAFGLTGLSLTVAVTATVLASSRPDVLDAAARRLGFYDAAQSYLEGPFAGYTASVGGAWVAAAVGVLAVFVVGWGLGKVALRLGRRG